MNFVFSFTIVPENSSLSPLRFDKFIVFSFEISSPENSSLSPLRFDKFIVFSFELSSPENSSLSPLRFDKFIVNDKQFILLNYIKYIFVF